VPIADFIFLGFGLRLAVPFGHSRLRLFLRFAPASRLFLTETPLPSDSIYVKKS